MSELRPTPLDTDSLSRALEALPQWDLEEGMLARTFSFSTYKEGLVFASALGWEADRMDHHPDLHIGYRKVKVATTTHDAGGLTRLDIELAQRADALAGD